MNESPEERLTKLFVGGLSHDTTRESMQKYFEQFGEVIKCTVVLDNESKKPRGFGYITYKDPSSSMEALNVKHQKGPHEIDGKECEVKRAIPREFGTIEFALEKTNKLFMGGLPEDATKEDVEQLLTEKLGRPPVSVSLMMRKEDNTKNRGYCFVDVETNDDADTLFCIRMVDIRGKQVEIKKSDPKGRSRGAGRGQGGPNANYAAPHAPGYNYSNPAAYGGAYGGYGGGAGYGAGYDPYRMSGYAYDGNAYGSGYGQYYSYPGYEAGYTGMGTYNQSASGYGPHKGGKPGRGFQPY